MSNVSLPTYRPALTWWFEEDYDADLFLDWIARTWKDTFVISAIYVAVIFGLKRFMQDRPKMDLRWSLMAWSGLLAIFSIIGGMRTAGELLDTWYHYGFISTVCTDRFYFGPAGFWGGLFILSKIWELGDTIFIVLRKTPLIFLHWYHHITVLIYTWFTVHDRTGPGRWFMVMNYNVHALMYSYYTLKAMRVRMPKPLGMFVTSLQILQMAVGVSVNIISLYVQNSGGYCKQTRENQIYGSLMYLSYFMLFVKFFMDAYFKPKGTSKKEANGSAHVHNGHLNNNNKKDD